MQLRDEFAHHGASHLRGDGVGVAHATGVYADVMNEVPKVVFSKTLTRADWSESRIASGDLAEVIDRLKRQPGGVIFAHGGATFVDALIRDGLIDEY